MIGKKLGVLVWLVVFALGCLLWSGSTRAQQQGNAEAVTSPLIRVLQAKGILSAQEVAQLNQASSSNDAEQRLAKLLLNKGVITQADYEQMTAGTTAVTASPTAVSASSSASSGVNLIPTVYRVPVPGTMNSTAAPGGAVAPPMAASNAAPGGADPNDAGQAQNPPPPQQQGSVSPTTLSAANPVRVFPVGGLKKGELVPAIKLAGIGITPYGFLKATIVYDSSSPGGDDFPLPGFLGDSGPNAASEFHIKARSTRFGTNFEWLDSSKELTVTGKFEMDFEGNFNRSDNRNLSSIRSYNPSIRLAYGRLDWKAGDNDNVNFLFGQDWTLFGSSTLPNILETTGLMVGFGNNYERAPQFRFGYTHNFGAFQFEPEVALVLPAVGDTPAAANLFNQLGYGERQGPDSGEPQWEGRFVGQFQLDHAPGVAPAQIIASWEYGHRTAIVLGSAVPAAFKAAFPTGATVSSPTVGWDGEIQLPTRYLTLVGKYYNGSDLRYYFAGQLFSNYNATAGLTGTADALSIDGASTVVFGMRNGVPVVAPQLPVRAQGGFGQIGLPISRWLGKDPEGRNAGWSAYALYGIDIANQVDVTHAAGTGSRQKSSSIIGTINYKLNRWVSFSFEESLYRTWANVDATEYPLFKGIHQGLWKDWRSEGGAIFSF